MFPSEAKVKYIREIYPVGARVLLHYMNDSRAVPPGTVGTIDHVDDAGTIHVNWDNGRRLGLIVGEDTFEII